MLKNTNLEEVKEVFKNLLYAVPIEPQIAAICCHPFTESSIVPKISITNDNIFKIEDSYWDLKKAEDYNEWTKYICKNIDEFKDMYHLFYYINKPYRLVAYKYSKDYLSLEDFSGILEFCWTTAENPNDDINVSIKELIGYFRKADKHTIMNEDEYKIWEELPDEFIVYRGISNHHNPKGLSWTRNKNVAEWFMNRWSNPDNYLLQATVKKEDCLCYFNGRDEDEIVVDSRHIKPKRIDYV